MLRRDFVKTLGCATFSGIIPSINIPETKEKYIPLPEVEIPTNNILGGIFTIYDYDIKKPYDIYAPTHIILDNNILCPMLEYENGMDFKSKYLDDGKIDIIRRAYQILENSIKEKLDKDAYNLLKSAAQDSYKKSRYDKYQYGELDIYFSWNKLKYTHLLIHPDNYNRVSYYNRYLNIIQNEICDNDKVIGLSITKDSDFAAYVPTTYELKIKHIFNYYDSQDKTHTKRSFISARGRLGMIIQDSSKVIIGNI
jgi:hypothetical protein